jgi:hypothetical protein
VWPPDDPYERLLRRQDRGRRRERVVAGALALALMAGLVGGGLVALGRVGGHGTARTGAGLGPVAPALGDGQYLYVRWTMVDPTVGSVTQSWWGTDGSGRTQFDCTVAGCDQPKCNESGSFCDSYSGPPDATYGPGRFPTDDDLTGLSTDPDELLPQLLARTAPGGHSPEPAFSPGPELTPGVTMGSLLDAIENILEDPNGTPELKVAVFQVASGLQGVTVDRGVTDPAGRPATSLTFTVEDAQRSYFFDPNTGLLMAVSWPSTPGTHWLYDQGIVPSTTATPSGDQWLFPPTTG